MIGKNFVEMWPYISQNPIDHVAANGGEVGKCFHLAFSY